MDRYERPHGGRRGPCGRFFRRLGDDRLGYVQSLGRVAAGELPQSRPIKALSQEQVGGLLQGKGTSLALPAELNSYPGPTHAIDLASELGLTPEQVETLEQIANEMSAEAKRLGAEIVEQERSLDKIFSQGTATAAKVEELAQTIGELQGRLRAVHLKAHLEVRRVLSTDKVDRYNVLRGYNAPAPAKAHGSGGHAN